MKKEIETFCPNSPAEWRNWLDENHITKQAVWLVYYKASTNIPSLTWSEAVDEALCFGWIDSTKKTIDSEKYMQYFSKRNPTSTWSKINKDKVKQLIENKLMKKAGFGSIERAKKNSTWTLMDDIEKLILPKDLETELNKYENAMDFFQRQTKSIKKGLLFWIATAKRPATRKKRIVDIAKSASNGCTPKHFR